MENRSSINRISGAMIFIIALLFVPSVMAQERNAASPQSEVSNRTKKRSFIMRTVDFIDFVLNDADTAYVAKNLYNLTIMPTYSYNYEHYILKSKTDKKQSIVIAPDGRNRMTFNVGWRWLIVGYSIDLQKSRPLTDFNLSLYSARFGLDLFYRKGEEGFRISRLSGFDNCDTPMPGYNKDFDGFAVEQMGAGLYYVFNKRFSYAAAYGQSTIQRKSAGSFILGACYNRQKFTFNHESLDPLIENQLNDELKFKERKYNNFSIDLGYSYNWVFAKNFLASISLTPAISYKHSEFKMPNSKNMLPGIDFDLTARAALVYNNGRYYAGTSLVSHSYSYNKEEPSIINSFGIVKVYVGYNFWRRK